MSKAFVYDLPTEVPTSPNIKSTYEQKLRNLTLALELSWAYDDRQNCEVFPDYEGRSILYEFGVGEQNTNMSRSGMRRNFALRIP